VCLGKLQPVRKRKERREGGGGGGGGRARTGAFHAYRSILASSGTVSFCSHPCCPLRGRAGVFCDSLSSSLAGGAPSLLPLLPRGAPPQGAGGGGGGGGGFHVALARKTTYAPRGTRARTKTYYGSRRKSRRGRLIRFYNPAAGRASSLARL